MHPPEAHRVQDEDPAVAVARGAPDPAAIATMLVTLDGTFVCTADKPPQANTLLSADSAMPVSKLAATWRTFVKPNGTLVWPLTFLPQATTTDTFNMASPLTTLP